ncbi:MAG: tetratricopeptide repeat protein [Bacteroidia bacterium]|nr:tetratricopeptide repeat protein [Bacteroidia bacterium]
MKKMPKKPAVRVAKAQIPLIKKDSWRWLIYAIIIASGFALYGNTISFKYAFDDTIVITGNKFVKQGFSGIPDIMSTDMFTGYYGKDMNMVVGGRYRPLSIATFAIEYQLFGENPSLSHVVNILLYGLTGFLIFIILSFLLKSSGIKKNWYRSVPLIAALLFMFHPLHTEVVANIKGRDEILALLLSLFTLWMILKYLETRRLLYIFYATVSFFLGLLSKENTITFLAVIPLTIYFFTGFSLKKNYYFIFPLLFVTLLFLVIRQSCIHVGKTGLENDLMNNPFVEMNFIQKYATIFYTLGLYLKLLFFPHPLTYDYYPYHIPIVNITELKALIPLAAYVILIVLAVTGFRKKSVLSYGILYYLVTLSIVSNLLFPIGAFMNERFAYMSSIGFCLVIPQLLLVDLKKIVKPDVLNLSVAGVLLLSYFFFFYIKTVTRNLDWENSFKLFTTDVKVSENSAKGNSLAGEYLIYAAKEEKDPALKEKDLKEAIVYLEKAIQIYPKHVLALFNLAAAHFQLNKDYPAIVKVYRRLLDINPDGDIIFQNLFTVMNTVTDVDYKLSVFMDFYKVNPRRFDLTMQIGMALNQKHDYYAAIQYLEKAIAINDRNYDAFNNLGYAYAQLNRHDIALGAFQKAENLKPNEPQILRNLAITWQNLGDMKKSNEYLEKEKQAKSHN